MNNRMNKNTAIAKLNEMGVNSNDPFYRFYVEYEGPFAGKGYEVLELLGESGIASQAAILVENHGFDAFSYPVTEYESNSVVIYNSQDGCVYEVDFEGGDTLYQKNNLLPRWNSWGEFVLDVLGMRLTGR